MSLVAVFLALGMGTLIGSSFISEATVSGLERSLRKLDENNRNLIADVRRLEDERGALHDFVAKRRIGQIAWNQFADSALGFDDRARVFRVRLLFR